MSVCFNHELLERDAAREGLNGSNLARKARVSQMTVSRFFRGGTIKPGTAKKLARALKQPLERYIVSDSTSVEAHQ